MLALLCRCALLAALLVVPVAVNAQGRATVRGADAVNVRERPSAESPTIVALRRGRVVTVDKLLGPWALITLDSGRQGYVKAAFLELPQGVPVEELPAESPAAGAAATPSPARTRAAPTRTVAARGSPTRTVPSRREPTQTATATHAETATPQAAVAPRGDLEREVAQLRDRLAALESAVIATPDASTPPSGMPGAAATMPLPTRHSDATRAGGSLLPSAAAPLEPDDMGPSLALAGLGLVVGFLFGAAYGRRQERNRRSRVRF